MRKYFPGCAASPFTVKATCLEMTFMRLQRISDFAENQVDKSSFFNKYPKNYEYLHAEAFAQVDSSNGVILNNLIGLA
jgi:hypothetical protein